MNPDWTTEQDARFDSMFDLDDYGNSHAVQKKVKQEIHRREALLIDRVVGEIHKLVQDKVVGGAYDFYCEDDGECFGDCTRSKDIARKEILTALQDLLASTKV